MEKLEDGFQWFLDLKVVLPLVIVATALLTLVAAGPVFISMLFLFVFCSCCRCFVVVVVVLVAAGLVLISDHIISLSHLRAVVVVFVVFLVVVFAAVVDVTLFPSLSPSTRLCYLLCPEKVFLSDCDRPGVDYGQPQPQPQPQQQVIHDKGGKVVQSKI